MTHGKMVIWVFVVFLIFSSRAHAHFAGNKLENVKLETNCSITNWRTEAYAPGKYQIVGDLTMTSGEECTIEAQWDSYPAGCVAQIPGGSVNSANCASFPSKVIKTDSRVEWTMTAHEAGCTGIVWLKVFDGTSLDPCLMIALVVEVSGPTEPLAAPKEVEASDGTYEDYVMITWDSVPDATYYEIFRDGSSIDISYETTYVDSPEEIWRRYEYSVKACKGSACSELSDANSGFRGPFPEIVNATDGIFARKIEIAWTSVDEAEVYEIYRSFEKGTETTLIGTIPKNITSFSDYIGRNLPNYVPGQKFEYFVKACNSETDEDKKRCSKCQSDIGSLAEYRNFNLHNVHLLLLSPKTQD
jgi:hypothetical protein